MVVLVLSQAETCIRAADSERTRKIYEIYRFIEKANLY